FRTVRRRRRSRGAIPPRVEEGLAYTGRTRVPLRRSAVRFHAAGRHALGPRDLPEQIWGIHAGRNGAIGIALRTAFRLPLWRAALHALRAEDRRRPMNSATFLGVLLLAAPLAAKTYPVDGIVVALDAQARTMLVSHRPIERYMAAMTMPFRVESSEAL